MSRRWFWQKPVAVDPDYDGPHFPYCIIMRMESAEEGVHAVISQWVVSQREYDEFFTEQVSGFTTPPFEYAMGRATWQDVPTSGDRSEG